jgi:hypothetical protein
MKVGGRINMRRPFVIALLLAFVLQGQLAASHIHIAAASTGLSLADANKGAVPKDQKRAPADDDCPICQQLASAHSFLAQVAVSVSLPQLIGAQPFEVFDERGPISLIALNWRSRAPPL